MVKAGIPQSISKEIVCKALQKTDLKWTYFQRKDTVNKEILLHTISFIKNTKPLKDHYLTANLLSLLLFYFLRIFFYVSLIYIDLHHVIC